MRDPQKRGLELADRNQTAVNVDLRGLSGDVVHGYALPFSRHRGGYVRRAR